MVSRHALLFATLVSASAAGAQPTLIQIKPHVGDTIRMHLTQTVEISVVGGTAADSAHRMTTSTEIFSRAIPKQWTSGGMLVEAVTDSMTTGPGGTLASRAQQRTQSPARHKTLVRVSADGAIEMVDDGDPNSEVRHLFAEMPATLSRSAVSVGEKWMREMQISLAGEPGATGMVQATFQLDSLRRSGDLAYVSLHGTISRPRSAQQAVRQQGYEAAGTISGSILIDRSLGWITDARTTIIVHSTMPAAKGKQPMRVRTRITQWARAMRAR